jgi:hypothetical protein
MCPPDPSPPVPDPDDLVTVREFNLALKIACDELHDGPFNPVARAELVRLINDKLPQPMPRSCAWRHRCGPSPFVNASAAFDVGDPLRNTFEG